MTVVDCTGGSTGSSLAYVCAAKGHRFRVVSSDAFAQEKPRTMAAFGAEVTINPSRAGRVTPDLLPRMIEQASEYAAAPDAYWTDQLHNRDSLVGYREVGNELLEQLDRPIDAFCAAVGTGGLAMGVSGALADRGSAAKIVLFQPASTSVISGGEAGTHSVEGIGIGLVPPLLDPDRYDEVRPIDETVGREMARRLAATGTSSGLNVVGAVALAAEMGPGRTVVTVAVDTGLKYLAGDLFAADPGPRGGRGTPCCTGGRTRPADQFCPGGPRSSGLARPVHLGSLVKVRLPRVAVIEPSPGFRLSFQPCLWRTPMWIVSATSARSLGS